MPRVEEKAEKVRKFLEEVKQKESPKVNIVLHSAPDPDCVGSGLGFQQILKANGVDSSIFYSGEISHPQNKTIVNVLNIVMQKTSKEIEGINVCVDCTPANSCAKDALLVIDHHKNQDKSKYSIMLPQYGACATIVWEIMKELQIEPSEENPHVHSALLLGIRTDTNDLISENMSKADFVAYQELLELADKESIQKVMNYPFPRYLYDKRVILHEEGNHSEANGIFVGGIGLLNAAQRDAIAILAEEYARMESVTTAIIFAIIDKKFLEVSIRSTNVSLDVNQMCKDLFGDYGGGSSYKGGAKIPLNFYSDVDDKYTENFWKTTCKHMFRKVLKESWVSNDE
jgi:nanoRNase/pAp phosphatase (c-di-AMP/oligoRNAs hydrolase)